MQSKLLIISFLFSMQLFAQTNIGKVKLIVEDDVNYFYSYDNQGRISETRNSKESYVEQYVYNDKDSIFTKLAVNGLDTILLEICLLDTNGLVRFMTRFRENNMFFCYMKYDNNNQVLSKIKQSDIQNSAFIYNNKNGNNLVLSVYDTIYKNHKFQISFSSITNIFSDKTNPVTYEIGGQSFNGMDSKNLPISSVSLKKVSDFCDKLPCPFLSEKAEKITYKYDYTFSENGRIKECKTTNTSTNQVSIKKYYYY